MDNHKTRKGSFATMDPDQQRAIASKGGINAHRLGKAHTFSVEEARAAGRKGGLTHSRDHLRKIGAKGGAVRALNRAFVKDVLSPR